MEKRPFLCLFPTICVVAVCVASLMVLAPEQAVGAELPEPVQAGPIAALLLLEEETVVTAIRHEQPISEAPSNIYVIMDEDILHSGATDLPTLLRRIPGIEIMQTTGADFNVSARGNNQLLANKMQVLVDGRSIYVDARGGGVGVQRLE